MHQTIKPVLILVVALLTACSGLSKFERRARHGDVNACDLYVHLLNEKMSLEGWNKQLDDKVYKYSKLCLSLDTGNWYSAYHNLQLAKSRQTNLSERWLYYYKAALGGEAQAQLVVAVAYYDGHPPGNMNDRTTVKLNKDSAFYWYEKAALFDPTEFELTAGAFTHAADMLYTGDGIKADTIKAIYYYKKACSCCNDYQGLKACDIVIDHYKKQKLKDTTEIMIYRDFAEPLRSINMVR